MTEEFAKKYNLPKYRIDQFNTAYYKEFVSSFDELTTWPKDLREKLKEEIPFSRLDLVNIEISKDGHTEKALFKTLKGNPVESVLIKSNKRNTVCVSCMSGCPVGCTFCATGKMGFLEALDSNSIVDQILFFERKLKSTNEVVSNIVYMGMGEPMLNLVHVPQSILILTGKNKMGLGHRRVTISTAGYIKELEKFLDMNLGCKIAISLHAPTQDLRDKLMPTVSKSNKIDSLLHLLDTYVKEYNKRITYEYILLKDINDTDECAYQLSTLLKNRLALVNIIEYNEVDKTEYLKSNRLDVFKDIIEKNNINVTVRKSYGNEISGACGQLASF